MSEDDRMDAPPAAAEIEAALSRMLDQTEAALGTRSRAFLQFIVSEALAGRSRRLKAFTIALAVFGRDSSFDPQTNSIVRVEATRLRRWLERYYAGAGADEAVEIRIPRGGYAPEFVRRLAPAPDEPQPSAPAPPQAVDAAPKRAKPPGRPLLATAAVLALLIASWPIAHHLGLGWNDDDFPVGSIRKVRPAAERLSSGDALRPSIRVALDAAGDDADERRFAADFGLLIENALSRFDNLIVVDPSHAADQDPDDTDYVLAGRVLHVGDGRASLVFRLSRRASPTLLWTKELADVAMHPQPEAATALIRALVTPLAQQYGVIFADLRRRTIRGDLPAGLSCFVGAVNVASSSAPDAHAAAQSCIDEAVRLDPSLAAGYAELADLRVHAYLDGTKLGGQATELIAARRAAERAVQLAPESARAQAAAFEVEFLEGKLDDAFRIGRHALDLNPFDTDIAARLGAAYARRGAFAEAMPLLTQASEGNAAYPAWIKFYFFLDAHLRGDAAAARRNVLDNDVAAFPLGLMARIIVDAENGYDDLKRQDLKDFVFRFPGFAASPRAALERFVMAPAIVDRLADELKQAGVPERFDKTVAEDSRDEPGTAAAPTMLRP